MYQRAVDALSEGVSPSWMGDSPASRVAMVANPDVSGHVLEGVVADHVLRVADDLENQEIPPVAQHECVRPTVLGVELDVKRMGDVEDEFLSGSLPVLRVDDFLQLRGNEFV